MKKSAQIQGDSSIFANTKMAAVPRPTLAPAVQAALGELRRRIRQYVWLEGCGSAIAWLGVSFWATLAIDWFFEPSAPVRAAMLAVVGLVLAAILIERIGRRAFVRISDSNAATVLERRFPELNDSLLTAVTLRDRLADDEVNPEMFARTCREAESHIAGVDVKQVFNARPLWLNGCAAGLLVLSVAFFAILFPESIGVWARRALALSPELWPRNTRLEVVGFPNGVQKIARGADLEVIARADAAMPCVPELVEVRYRTDGGSRGRATMDRRGVARGTNEPYQQYAYTFRSVLGDVHFDVVGGDDRVADRWIQVVESPTISEMTLRCELPAYIGRKPYCLPVTGVMPIPMGSNVTVCANAANKDLVRVEINRIVDDQPQRASILEAKDLNPDRRGFRYTVPNLRKDTTLLVTLTDSDGIKSRDPLRITLTPLADQPPQMEVQLDGIGAAVTPQARLPAVGRIRDEYGIGRFWFESAVDEQKPEERSLGEFTDPPTEFELNDVGLELGELHLAPGQKLLVSVKAADLCDLGAGPNVAGSERWTLDVVTPEQLRAMLESRELVLRQRFERMIQEMTETRDSIARLEFDASKADKADSPEQQRSLRQLRVQGSLTNCGKIAQEVLGLAEAFDNIRKQLVNNRIDTTELNERLRVGIADPLRAAADGLFPELERRLEVLRESLDNIEKGPALRDDARRQADAILLAMQKILDRMLEIEDFNEIVELLRGIIQMQDQLNQSTQERHKQKIRELLKD